MQAHNTRYFACPPTRFAAGMLNRDRWPAPDADLRDDRRRIIERLYASEIGRLRRFLRQRLPSAEDAADVAHDVFVLFARVSPATIIDKPEAYLRRIAQNVLRDRAARSATRISSMQVPESEGMGESDQIDQHRTLEARLRLERCTKTLERLKPKTLRIFILHRVDGLSYKQIGTMLGMSEGGVKRHMVNAIKHIARAGGDN